MGGQEGYAGARSSASNFSSRCLGKKGKGEGKGGRDASNFSSRCLGIPS